VLPPLASLAFAPAADGRASPGRRAVLRLAAAGAAWLVTGGHAPYGQWGLYRKRFLLILTNRADPPSFELGKIIAAVLAERLPESRARVSRAPHGERIASLLATKQMDVALMRPADAAALRAGARPFADFGPVPLETIVGVGDFLLVCRNDFPARHAWLVAAALAAARGVLPAALRPVASAADAPDPRVPLHAGARGYFAGAPAPPPDPAEIHDHADGGALE
jgi:hypothetical protein